MTKRNRSKARIGFSRDQDLSNQADINQRKSGFYFKFRIVWSPEEKPSWTKLLCLSLKIIIHVIDFQDNRMKRSGKCCILSPSSRAKEVKMAGES